MITLHIQNSGDTLKRTSRRKGETKLGESVQHITSLEGLQKSTARYVIFGISEDIGVQANYGNKGTAKAWDAFFNAFVNIQENAYNNGSEILILGHITVAPEFPVNQDTPKERLGTIVSAIDHKVAQVVSAIVAAGKIPVIIGGGHNNAFGNIKGTSLAMQRPIGAFNIDAHTDLRDISYRHSGNGFTQALQDPEGPFLNRYAVFGLHENYTPQYIFDFFKAHPETFRYSLFEEGLRKDTTREHFLKDLDFIAETPFGLELDCDAISDFPSSARTPSGFALNTVRYFVTQAAAKRNCRYFHLCEAAPDSSSAGQVGKALSYLVSDFIKAHTAGIL